MRLLRFLAPVACVIAVCRDASGAVCGVCRGAPTARASASGRDTHVLCRLDRDKTWTILRASFPSRVRAGRRPGQWKPKP